MSELQHRTCQFYQNNRRVCGYPATREVVIDGATVSAKIALCGRHLAVHNERAAASRVQPRHNHTTPSKKG